jgi:hypothetical protein
VRKKKKKHAIPMEQLMGEKKEKKTRYTNGTTQE